MFHLFKKTYLATDQFIDKDSHRIVISSRQGFPILNNASNLFSGRLFAHGTSLSEIVGPTMVYPTFADMLRFCSDFNTATDEKIVIYCDPQSWMEFTSKWFKIIFKNINSDAAWKINLSYFNQAILLGIRGQKYLQDQIREFFGSLSRSEFETIFNSSTVNNDDKQSILDNVTGFRSLEFLIGTYLYNGSYKDELKSALFLFINRATEEYAKEAWRGIQEGILNPTIQELFRLRTDYSLDNMLEMADDPAIQSLKNTNAWRHLGGVGNVHQQMDITNYTPSQVTLLKEVCTAFHLTDGEYIHLFLDISHRGYLIDDDLDTIIGLQRHISDPHFRFYGARDIENLRVYLISYFIINQENTSVLSPFELE